MEFGEVVRKRRMVRHCSAEPVAPEAVEQILEMARHARSAGFTQGQSFVVVTEPVVKQAIARACAEEEYIAGGFHRFISQAPVLIIPCTSEAAYHRRYQEPDKLEENGQEIAWPVPYWHMDIGCSVMLVLLAPVEAGLAAGFADAADLYALRAVLVNPADASPGGLI